MLAVTGGNAPKRTLDEECNNLIAAGSFTIMQIMVNLRGQAFAAALPISRRHVSRYSCASVSLRIFKLPDAIR
jgi:hypothetical protein